MNGEAIQAGSSLLSMIAIVAGAVTFIFAQYDNFFASRRIHHQYVMDQYHQFLAVAMSNSKLRLGYGLPADERSLSQDELYERDVGFDMLTSMLELAFHTYAGSFRADRKSQWHGWDLYMRHYVDRADYQGWWLRVILGGDINLVHDLDKALAENITQLDRRSESYILPLVRHELLHGLAVAHDTTPLAS